MFHFAGWLSQVSEPDRWGQKNPHCEFRLGISPTRLTIVLSDLDRSRAWRLVSSLELRTAREGSEIPLRAINIGGAFPSMLPDES